MTAIAADEAWLERSLRVLGASTGLAHYLTRVPSAMELLRDEPRPRGESWRQLFRDRVAPFDQSAPDRLRRANHEALVAVAAWDVNAEDPAAVVDQISAELSHIADAVLDCAVECAKAETPGAEQISFAVIAMGKLGAQELNVISDVDVIYIAEPVEGVEVDEAMRVGSQLAAALGRICSAHTAEGTIWPVDAALRPEGKAGPLVRTVASCQAYYRSWAKNWEFQALLKARPAAGDLALGQRFCDMVQPFIWEAALREGFLAEARAMRQRVVSLIPAKAQGRDIKLGVGGLRDTEFTVQLLQLVHGRADPRLRVRGTFPALESLIAHGYISRVDGAALAAAYRTQRVLEHRVQLRRLRRTHLMPDDEAGWTHLARTLELTVDEVVAQWRSSTRAVERLQRRIFFSPLLDAVSAIPTNDLRLSATAAQDRLRALGFTDPRSALGHIQALTNGTSRAVEIQRQLMPVMLSWFAEGPNPDFGLLAFRQLSEALGSTSWFLRALRDEGWMAQRLARIAASSRYVVNLLMKAPEMVQMLASSEELVPRSRSSLTQAMTRAITRSADQASTAASIRALRRSELCRIALADVLGLADIATVGQALSDVAGASVDAALDLARREIAAPQIGVIAMGRWGGAELSYASDIDALFVIPDGCSPEEQEAAVSLVRLASDLIGKPGPDPALIIDADLRPEGKGGPLVRSLSSYLSYYRSWAATWEYQALLRARAGAGDHDLAQAVVDQVAALRYPSTGLQPEQIIEIRRLKSRMEKERIPRGMDKARHLKLGSGGLSDIEWTIQLLQLQNAGTHSSLRTTSTMTALRAAERLGLLSAEQATDLTDAWMHVSRVRNAIMLVRGRPSDALPVDYRELAALAALLGYDPGEHSRLDDETRRLMRRAMRTVTQVFWGE